MAKTKKLYAEDIDGRVVSVFKSLKSTEQSDVELLSTDYLDQGLIDSLQIVEFIARLEKEFAIGFEATELESERFRILRGVAAIIKNKLS